ncbi:c-type cytochrome biogenesis protein CcmI [Mangrovibrevibacter kandeliae]|uniref:c-type cytochrome biogenesis protein CcmI n=1 Tax=Mangrovibrevibacter kandeliae TaxID=2968473 RepID=UPI0021182D8C|nr:c-type cytochrome biogenesis protein CcmI [Aurantimonas sp. CSK15Z-1]MCQ8781095.1 c-type cytochrome biogenesis protein CcmI [Aurantimonas sp. CSK15Z-1]
MLFWVVAASLTAIVTLAAVWPVLRPRTGASPVRAEHDLEVYRAQLGELDGDVARGALRSEDAQTARAEIGRRLLRAAEQAEGARARPGARRGGLIAVAVVVAVAVPALSLAVYGTLGSPAMPDLPLEARAGSDPSAGGMTALIAQAEERLKQAPDDGRGWDVLAPIYLRLSRYEDAAKAYRNAIRLLGSSAAREAGLGQAATEIAGGEVTQEAKSAFERALALDPTLLQARFFLALDLSQEARYAEALPAWRQVVADSPPNAPWMAMAKAAVADAAQRTGAPALAEAAPDPRPGAIEPPTSPGPDADQVAAASQLSSGDRQAMIEGMVAQLAERLKSDPKDAEGWKKLIRSYNVLGQPDAANAALRDAQATFPPESPEGTDIATFARDLGVTGAGETRTP